MKKALRVILGMGIVAVFVLTVLNGWAGGDAKVSVSPAEVKEAGTLTISGSGFKPNQKVAAITMMGGVLSDISLLMKPELEKTDGQGAFTVKWKLKKRYGKFLKPTSNPITIVDKDGKKLASTEFKYEKTKKKK